MSRVSRYVAALILVVAIGAGVAVVNAPDPVIAGYRDALLLENEPSGSVTIEDARKTIESETQVVLTARIGAREIPQWWEAGSASFYVSEATEGSHYNATADHDPQACPFCRHKWKVEDSMALVHLVDNSGERIEITAPDLLDVGEGDVVVVKGTASLNDSGFLVVESDGLFVRK